MLPENFTRYALVHILCTSYWSTYSMGQEQMFAGYDLNLPISGHNYNGRY